MSSQSINSTDSQTSCYLTIATLAGLAWALSYVSWPIALPLWLVGSIGCVHSYRPHGAKEWFGFFISCFGVPATAFAVYYFLAPVA